MANRKRVFIVNPTSGKGKSIKFVDIIKSICEEKKVDYEIHYTNGPHNATEIASRYSKNCIVYSVGGDGTLSEVINGLVHGNSYLGIIPTGSGNDFYKTYVDLEHKLQSIDLGRVNDIYFINIASIGIDAEVANNAILMKRFKLFGMRIIPPSMIYNMSVIYSLMKRKNPIIEIDGSSKKITLMAICNGKYYGNGFKIAPSADVADGLFDVYIADDLSLLQISNLLPKLKKGLHTTSPFIKNFKDGNVSVKTSNELVCNIDGEIIRGKEFNFTVCHNAITLYNKDDLDIMKYLDKIK